MNKVLEKPHSNEPLEEEEPVCRLCLGSEKPLIRICNCSGTIKFVHYGCAGEWISHQLDDDIVDHFEDCEIPHCELCGTKYSISMSLQEESLQVQHFAYFYSRKDWWYKIYMVFLSMGMTYSMYFILIGINMWQDLNNDQTINMFWSNFIFPSWFISHTIYTIYKETIEINKLRQKYVFIQFKPSEEIDQILEIE